MDRRWETTAKVLGSRIRLCFAAKPSQRFDGEDLPLLNERARWKQLLVALHTGKSAARIGREHPPRLG